MSPISIDLPLGAKEIVIPCDFFPCGSRQGLTARRVLLDTGAYPTILSSRLIEALGLQPIDKGVVSNSERQGTTALYYQCDIRLPNGLRIHGVRVSSQPLPDLDALLGFDILSLGDFRIQRLQDRIHATFALNL